MIKYKVWYKEFDGTEKDFGTIEGYNKVDMGLQLYRIIHKYNLDKEHIRLENLEFNIDKQENL
jgi:hypothetical protein